MCSENAYTIKQQIQVSFNYDVVFTESAFSVENPTLANTITAHRKTPPKLLVVIDSKVHQAHPGLIFSLKNYASIHNINLVKPPLIVTGGEQIKREPGILEKIYRQVADEQIDRHSYILAIGGGAVLDAVGYAAATAHRGIRLVRMPSTVLAQNDAGVGVKNGVNLLGRKNFLGSFAPPYAVINDFNLLETLDIRDKRAGIAEAVKVALIKDRAFFNELFENRRALAKFEPTCTRKMIIRCAELHLEHIRNSGDPFEMGSARPLDFGHWSAHRLESLSSYQLRHGEAVAIGIALDTIYSGTQGLIGRAAENKILVLLSDLGFELSHPVLDIFDVKQGLDEFREHLGGQLCITLLKGLGKAREYHQIDIEKMQACVQMLQNHQNIRVRA